MQKVFGAMREKGKGRLIPPFWRLRELKMTSSNAREERDDMAHTLARNHNALRRQRAIIGIFTNAGSTMLQPSLKPFQLKFKIIHQGACGLKQLQ